MIGHLTAWLGPRVHDRREGRPTDFHLFAIHIVTLRELEPGSNSPCGGSLPRLAALARVQPWSRV